MFLSSCVFYSRFAAAAVVLVGVAFLFYDFVWEETLFDERPRFSVSSELCELFLLTCTG